MGETLFSCLVYFLTQRVRRPTSVVPGVLWWPGGYHVRVKMVVVGGTGGNNLLLYKSSWCSLLFPPVCLFFL